MLIELQNDIDNILSNGGEIDFIVISKEFENKLINNNKQYTELLGYKVCKKAYLTDKDYLIVRQFKPHNVKIMPLNI